MCLDGHGGGNLGVGLVLAWQGAGVWAYVAALLVQNVVLSLGYLLLARIPWLAGFNVARIRQLLGYGMRSTAFNLLTYAAAKVDVWLVGEKLSTGQTGIYDRAVHLMGQPITVLGKLGDSVLFSGMASIQNDDMQTRNVTLRAMHFVALFTIPLASALVIQAEGVTWLFLGDRFASAAPVVQILFAAVVFRALTKLGDANLRALDGLNMGIAIKLIFFLAVGIGVFFALGPWTWPRRCSLGDCLGFRPSMGVDHGLGDDPPPCHQILGFVKVTLFRHDLGHSDDHNHAPAFSGLVAGIHNCCSLGCDAPLGDPSMDGSHLDGPFRLIAPEHWQAAAFPTSRWLD